MKPHRIRTFLAVLLSVALALSVGIAAAAEQSASGFQYIANETLKTAQITGYNGSPITLNIPDKLDGYEVRSLNSEAFKGKNTLLSVTIPNTVETIGSECFSGCTLLASVTLGNKLSTIGAKAFENCAVLSSVTLPASVSSIGAQAFVGCKALSSFSVNSSSKSFKAVDHVLFNYAGTKLVAYPAGRSSDSYAVPEVTDIESYAFCGAKNLTAVTLSSSTTTVGKGAFKDCAALTQIKLPEKLTKIEDELFSGCKKLSVLSFPNTVKTIGANAFSGCAAIPALTIADSVTTVGSGAFSDCTGITSVTIGKGLTAVSGAAFSGCTGVTEFKVVEGASFSAVKGVLFNKDGTRLVAYPAGSTAAEYTIGDKVTAIGLNAFDSCKNLKKLHIPATVKTIAEPVAVKDCDNLVIYVEDASSAKSYFQSHTTGFAALKIGADLPGDVNADGVVDNADVILLRRYVAKWKNVSIHTDAADVNKDSEVDNADVILLRRFVAGWKNVTLK